MAFIYFEIGTFSDPAFLDLLGVSGDQVYVSCYNADGSKQFAFLFFSTTLYRIVGGLLISIYVTTCQKVRVKGSLMFEKVNPAHPDKIADRVAGAIVDLAYKLSNNPKIAVEVMLGHGECFVMVEASPVLQVRSVEQTVAGALERAGVPQGSVASHVRVVAQDPILSSAQLSSVRCGDNGIFKGVPVSQEQKDLLDIARNIYYKYLSDGKYIIDGGRLTICQSNSNSLDLKKCYPDATINPLGEWVGGPDVDTGCTNRKLGSDMGDAVTGGGLHGKDLSKADVSVNIYAHLKAQSTGQVVELSCAIGDKTVDGRPYKEIVDIARTYIEALGGFEKFAEWGLIR